ncbi:MAG: gas vesicle protein K [Cyanobacteria bacterium P01_E01_bin.6]
MAPIDASSVQNLTVTEATSPIQLQPPTSKNPDSGLAPLLLTVVELIRQLMEAQVIRRMDANVLSDHELDRAAESLQTLEEQVLKLCDIFDVDPADLNIDLGEVGTLLPKSGYYPGEKSSHPSILELLDRLLNVGIVLEGSAELGLAQLDLIHAKLQLVLTSQPISARPPHRLPVSAD